MTAITATSSPMTRSHGNRWPRIAGFTYVGAWVVGLTAFGAGPAADASNSELARYFADHRAGSATQSLLIHGVAAVALLAVVAAIARSRTSTRVAQNAGLVAVALSLVQCGLDMWRSLVSTGATTATLVHAVDRIDGVKIFALAVMIGASVAALRSAGTIGPRMATTGKVAAAALVVSGVAYAGAVRPLLVSADLSLLLLLTWVGYLGVATGRRTV
jgi:hypothetical protein